MADSAEMKGHPADREESSAGKEEGSARKKEHPADKKEKKGKKKQQQKKSAVGEFFAGVKAEFRKVVWPDRRSTLRQSVAVVAISVVMGVIIAMLDRVAQWGVTILTSIGRS